MRTKGWTRGSMVVALGAVAVAAAGLSAVPAARADHAWSGGCPDGLDQLRFRGFNPVVAASVDGSRVRVAWSRPDGVRWRMQVIGSADGGATWGPRVDLSDPAMSVSEPDLASSADGSRLALVWGTGTLTRRLVQVVTSSDGGATWGSPATVYSGRYGVEAFRVVSSADGGRLTAVWGQIVRPRIEASSSSDGGLTWTPYAGISGTLEDRTAPPELASSADGSLVTVLMDGYGNGGPTTSTTTDGGVTWAQPVYLPLAGDHDWDWVGQVASSADGTRVYAAFAVAAAGGLFVGVSRSDDFGATWQAPSRFPGWGDHARVTTSADGARVAAAWATGNEGDRVVRAAGSSDAGVTWSVPVDVSVPGAVCGLRLATSADGTRLTAVWTSGDGATLTAMSAGSSDGGLTWSTPVALSPAGAYIEAPQIVASADGLRLSAVWRSRIGQDGEDWIVQTVHSSDGGATWSSPADLSVAGQPTPITIAQVLIRPLWLPATLRPSGWTRLIDRSLRTNAGQDAQVEVTCLPRKRQPPSGRRGCRSTNRVDTSTLTERSTVRVWLSGTWRGRVRVSLHAPAVTGFQQLRHRVVYRVTPSG